MAGRDTSMVTDVSLTMPGPGAYEQSLTTIVSKYAAPKGGRALANRSRRFEPGVGVDVPGPGAYDVERQNTATMGAAAGKSTPGGGSQAASRSAGASAGPTRVDVVVNNRLKFLRKPEAPSIPTPGQAYGYEENDDGTLRRQEAPDTDATLGPAFYGTAAESKPRSTALYKGVFFGNKTSRRDFAPAASAAAAAAVPGPADYDLIGAALRQAAIKEPSTMALAAVTGLGSQPKPDAKLPRYHDIVSNEASRQAIPGPGKYNVPSQFDAKPKVTFDGYEVEHPPFGTQEKRFGDATPSTRRRRAGNAAAAPLPGPGTYTDPRTALEAHKKISSLKKCPFNQTALRFEPAPPVRATPGPGRYNLMGLAAESVKKAYFASTTRGAFGSTEVRKNTFLGNKKDETAPGPANYVGGADRRHRERAPPRPTAPFASRTRRGQGEVVQTQPAEDSPAPGSYDVVEAYEKLSAKKSSEPRTTDARRRRGAFMSSVPRLAASLPVIAEATPGPGAYEGAAGVETVPTGGRFVYKERRFKDGANAEARPGPAHYELSPQVQHTVLKSTFNVTLANPVAQKMEEREREANQGSRVAMAGAA